MVFILCSLWCQCKLFMGFFSDSQECRFFYNTQSFFTTVAKNVQCLQSGLLSMLYAWTVVLVLVFHLRLLVASMMGSKDTGVHVGWPSHTQAVQSCGRCNRKSLGDDCGRGGHCSGSIWSHGARDGVLFICGQWPHRVDVVAMYPVVIWLLEGDFNQVGLQKSMGKEVRMVC